MDVAAELRKLYDRELAELSTSDSELAGYLRAHSATTNALERQIAGVRRYLPHVSGRVLDWGCMHAPDAAILRLLGRDDLEIHGCDIFPEGTFPAFHGFAGLRYRVLDHHARLPYPDEHFDVVVGDGVLEHVPNDWLSLQEVYRVLKPSGHFILCCLPNRFSWTEWLGRCLRLPHHLRTYSMRQARSMLLHSGFHPIRWRHYQMVPSLSGAGMSWRGRLLRGPVSVLWRLNGLLERLWPMNRLASNLFLVGRKCRAITWSCR